MSSEIIKYLEKIGRKTVEASYYAKIQDWYDWYQNGVDEWHKTTYFNGISVVNRNIKSLGMAKTVCETWANLMMNEKVQINTGNEQGTERLNEVLKANNFRVKANQLCELYFALGTGAFVEYLDKSEVRIDYVNADLIYPLSWDSRGIRECAFGSRVHQNTGDCIYLQLHLLNSQGNYIIENHMIMDDDMGDFKEVDLPPGMARSIQLGTSIPCFQILMPNIVNNVDIKNPLGVSVYANAIDCLKEIDTTFDALDVEVNTGRRMVFLASQLFFTDSNGDIRNVIGQKETVLRFIGDVDDTKDSLIHDFSPALRITDLKDALQFQLNLLSEKTGMGTNQFEFTAKGVKTATEVISEDSDLYQNLKKHEIILESALVGMIEAISYLSGKVGQPIALNEITIEFDDSIIEDKEAERKQDAADLANGTLRPEEYRAKWRNETLEEAKKNLPEQADVLP